MKNIKLTLEYDGTGYAGWQWQPNVPTIQSALEAAISRTSKEELRVTASGRTDAGVHAFGQVVNFKTEAALDANAWRGALNHFLPVDIRVMVAEEVAPDFSARYSSKGKRYGYIILNRGIPSAIKRNFAWNIPYPLDVEAMKEGAAHLVGTHDFTSLRATACDAVSPIKELRELEVGRDDSRIFISLEASGFLRHMVRNIVGTLVEVGRGQLKPEDVRTILEMRDRTKAGPTAPPQGLYLVAVEY